VSGAESVPDSAYRPCVGIMLLNPANLVFVARRIDMSEEAWQMPQGGIDGGEAPREAALRELKEEIGTDKAAILAESRDWLRYDLPPALIGKAWGGRYRGQRQKWFAMRFTGRDSDIDLATDHPEFSAWKWVAPASLPQFIVPFKRQLYMDVLAEFAPLLTPPAG
jgi:putative (di)nucleoside polyphosphate hydrolase